MSDPMHFDGRAEAYASARPPYPPELWAGVRGSGLLEPGLRALDLGAGTGQATGPLLAAGLSVVAVEPGSRLAALLRELHPAAEVVVARAEDYGPAAGAFDLAVAATSIHWMDLGLVLPKIRLALKPDGRFLVWRNVFGDSTVPPTPFRQRVQEIVDRRREPLDRGHLEDARATADAIARGGLFEIDGISTYRWTIELDEQQVRVLFGTFSDWTDAEAGEAAAAVRDLGGMVTEHYSSWLIIASPQP